MNPFAFSLEPFALFDRPFPSFLKHLAVDVQSVFLVVQSEFEASPEVARQALLHLDVPMDLIQQYTGEVREELHRPLYKDWQKTND